MLIENQGKKIENYYSVLVYGKTVKNVTKKVRSENKKKKLQ